MENCDFCSKEITDKQGICSSDLTNVIYPQRPIVLGHFMITSNSHTPTLDKMSTEEIVDIHLQLKKLVELMQGEYGYTGYNVIVNNGKSSGQHIPHLHIHLLMRSREEAYSPLDVLSGKVKKEVISEEEWNHRMKKFRETLAK